MDDFFIVVALQVFEETSCRPSVPVVHLTFYLTILFNLSVQPTATLDDSNTKTVPEHSDVYYSCEGKNGVPASTVSWYKGKRLVVKGKTLSLRNIKREQAGSYTCKVQSGTLKDETVLDVIVQCKYLIITYYTNMAELVFSSVWRTLIVC